MYLRSPAGWVYPPITTEPEGARKYFGALLVGFYEGRRLKFAGRVGTGFSDKLLRSLFADLSSIGVEKCPFYNVPAAGRRRRRRRSTKKIQRDDSKPRNHGTD